MQLPNAADELPAFDENEATVGREAATVTPTTTGTVGGAFYGMSPEYNRPAWAPPVNQDRRTAALTDFVLGFAGPTMTMEDALRGLGAEEAKGFHRALRYFTRTANRVPDEGPQVMAERTAAVQAAADVPAARNKLLHRVAQLSTKDVQNAIDRGDWPRGTETFAEKAPKKKGLASIFKETTGESATYGDAHTDPRWENFQFRKDMKRLGWTPKDLEGVSRQRLLHIWNTKTPNAGQAWKYRAIEAGRKADAENATLVSRELDRQAKQLGEHLDFVDYLKQHGGQEVRSFPLEPSETLNPTEHSARWATQQLKKPGGPLYRPPENPWPPK